MKSQTETTWVPRDIVWFERRSRALELAMERDRPIVLKDDWSSDTQSSCRFLSTAAAWRYYSDYGCSWDDVEQKEKDGRAVILTPAAQQRRETAKKAQEKRSRICGLLWPAREMTNAIARAVWTLRERGQRIYAQATSKAGVEREIKRLDRPWELSLPYCCYGKPKYYDSAFCREEMKKKNRRALVLTYGIRKFTIVRMRRCRNSPVPTHWGMADARPWVVVFDEHERILSGPAPTASNKDIVRIILDAQQPAGRRAPKAKTTPRNDKRN